MCTIVPFPNLFLIVATVILSSTQALFLGSVSPTFSLKVKVWVEDSYVAIYLELEAAFCATMPAGRSNNMNNINGNRANLRIIAPPIVHTASLRPIGLIGKSFHKLILFLLLFFIKKLLNTDCHQTDYQTHERDKHYAENEADIKTPSPDEITQAEMTHRVIIKIGPVFPHHDINHDANINEEKQSYYQDSLFFFG